MEATRTDPITLEIIQNSLQAISDEMFSSMRKRAMSAAAAVTEIRAGARASSSCATPATATSARRGASPVRARRAGFRKR
jgi:hypothetical protein